MITKIIEAAQGPEGPNWGKFMLMRFDHDEWQVRSSIDPEASLLRACGWSHDHLWVLDLQTGEGAFFRPGGSAHADLDKHRVWVCVLFESFLEWLYTQDLRDLTALPDLVELPDAPMGTYGYRRPGPVAAEAEALHR